MGNDIKCGCKCQHSSQDDEVSFPSGLGKITIVPIKVLKKLSLKIPFRKLNLRLIITLSTVMMIK